MIRLGALALALAGMLAVAGCADTADSASVRPDDLHVGGTGSIMGTVTDDSLAPLADATVSLDASIVVSTDENGAFSFAQVTAGDHVLAASMPGFQDTVRAIQVEAGVAAEVGIILAHTPGLEPYHETRIGVGMIGCAVSIRHPANSFPLSVAACGVFAIAGVPGIDKWRTDWKVGPLLNSSGAFVETQWTQNQAGAAAMIVQWATNSPDLTVQTFNSTWGKSPLRMRIPIEEIAAVTAKAKNPACTMEQCTWNAYHFAYAGTLGSGSAVDFTILVQQRFTDYLTVFYNQPLPEEFSAIRDA